MKPSFMKALLCIALIFISFMPVAANAEVNIAVVDIDKILSESKAAKSIQKQVKTKREGFLAKVKSEEDKLRAEQKAIENQRTDLSKEELIKKAQDFEKRRMAARKKIKTRKNKLDNSYTEAMAIMTKSIYDVCQAIADEEKIDLIITRQNIIVGSKSLDITKKVMVRLNKKVPSLNLNVK